MENPGAFDVNRAPDSVRRSECGGPARHLSPAPPPSWYLSEPSTDGERWHATRTGQYRGRGAYHSVSAGNHHHPGHVAQRRRDGHQRHQNKERQPRAA